MNESRRKLFQPYFWLSIEGTDAVGKTTLLKEIEKFLKNQKKTNLIVIKEFSNCPMGKLIKEIINKKRFFSLGNRVHYPLSETLLPASDFIYQFESLLLKHSGEEKLFIFSDRGPYSFLTYQLSRINRQYRTLAKIYIKKWIKNLFDPIGLPHFIILLISPISDIKRRIVERDGYINEDELQFIQEIQNEYLKIFKKRFRFPHLILENSDGNFEYFRCRAIKRIKGLY